MTAKMRVKKTERRIIKRFWSYIWYYIFNYSGANCVMICSRTFLACVLKAFSFFSLAKFLTRLNIGAYLSISGTITNATLDPLIYILVKYSFSPFFKVTCTFSKRQFMVSSTSIRWPRYVSPVFNSIVTTWFLASWRSLMGMPMDIYRPINRIKRLFLLREI